MALIVIADSGVHGRIPQKYSLILVTIIYLSLAAAMSYFAV